MLLPPWTTCWRSVRSSSPAVVWSQSSSLAVPASKAAAGRVARAWSCSRWAPGVAVGVRVGKLMEGGGSQLLPAASYCCIASHPWCLVQPPDAAAAPRQQHGGDIETGLMRPSTSQPHAVAAPVAAAAAFTTAAAVAAAATTSSSLSPETGRESSPAPAAASTAGGEGEGADISSLEELSFVRKVQQRQRQSLGARPTLGGLFASADSGGEDGAAAAVAQQQPEPSVAPALRTLDSPLSLRRPPSGSSLQTIAEGQQHLTPLHEHRPAAAAAAQLPSEDGLPAADTAAARAGGISSRSRRQRRCRCRLYW